MPNFFFHGRYQEETYPDFEGTVLLDLAAALVEAAKDARAMMADELRCRPLTPGRSIDIADEDGRVLATVAFHDCIYEIVH